MLPPRPPGPLDSSPPDRTVDLPAGALADLAVAIWRLDTKLPDGAPGRRQAHAVRDALTDAGVETQAYDGVDFDPGLAIRVIAFQPTAGLQQERILETVRPAVSVRGAILTLAEVIVGVPVEKESA
ncbi:hypothetical protein OG394_16820 [Kribbella sp. NBC_01245]|uniref:hypothetical protein n=1 Tax=Kribbella sp. NBC_01245 TaxID=2903578 RepID=UPI002E284E4E|nr:hypothetical protein [Kribbella sp. NBC_01245]